MLFFISFQMKHYIYFYVNAVFFLNYYSLPLSVYEIRQIFFCKIQNIIITEKKKNAKKFFIKNIFFKPPTRIFHVS